MFGLENNHKTITAHMVVKNEDQWVWFAIMSVIDYVDKMLIFDTGSIDRTADVIRIVAEHPDYKDKIYFEEVGAVTPQEFPKVRQRQIDMTDTDYVLVVDGDEIWWKDALLELHELIDKESPPIVNIRFIVPCADLFHYRDFKRELYVDEENNIYGSINCRAFSMKIPGVHCSGDYGVEGYTDADGRWSQYHTVCMEHYYFHCTKLRRSSAKLGDESIPYRRRKIFDDWDYTFPKDYKYPEVFYLERPEIVPDPFKSRDNITKRVAKHLARFYRFVFKRKTYIETSDRD